MRRNKVFTPVFFLFIFSFVFSGFQMCGQGIIADHNCTDITQIPESAIIQAKEKLHIAYGHTSHGSQITTGMEGLINFANNGGRGLSLASNIFAFNNGGTNGALDLEEGDGYGNGWLDHDCGYHPSWVNETREYLNDASHTDVNVIMWSWCGQASDRSEQGMIDTYLQPMTQLEKDFPDVTFVYMTGHADGSGETGNLHLRNQQIRQYCIDNNKVLFDFYDIECYNPDGTYFGDKNVSDNCAYTGGNWAQEWQNSHTENTDWYNCSAAHSEPLNANQKAYAIWWLWAKLAGWATPTNIDSTKKANEIEVTQNSPNPAVNSTQIKFTIQNENKIDFEVYNVTGKQIFKKDTKIYLPGSYEITINTESLPSGIYFYRIKNENFTALKKMLVSK
jgi:hypothetical protein